MENLWKIYGKRWNMTWEINESMDWFKGKIETANHGFSHEIGGVPVNDPPNPLNDMGKPGKLVGNL